MLQAWRESPGGLKSIDPAGLWKTAKAVSTQVWLARCAPLFCFAPQSLRLGLQRPSQLAAAREVRFRFRQFTLYQPHDAAASIGVGQAWIKLQSLVEIGNRPR